MAIFLRGIIISCIFCSLSSQAATKYVSDTLYIPIKSDINGGKVIRHLKSGTAMSIIDRETDPNYIKVKVKDSTSTEGWVKKRYLLDEPIAKSKLARLESQLDQLKTQQEPLKKQVAELKQKLKVAVAERKAYEAKSQGLATEISEVKEISSEALSLNSQVKSLSQLKDSLTSELTALKSENTLLKANQKNEGLRLGLLAVGIGMMAGFLLPYIKPSFKRSRSRLR